MTDTANAPERIWTADTTGTCSVGFNTPSLDYKNEYISRTHCDELVAAAYLDAARVPTSFLVGDPPNGIPFRSPMAHEVAEAIKDRTPDDASATLTAFGERMKAEGAREAQAKIARLTEALKEISSQKKTSEFDTEYDVECADFEGGYDTCIDRARAIVKEIANE